MAKDFTAVILFNSEPYLLKNLMEEKKIALLVDQILESEAVGFTNIARALKRGLQELDNIHGTRKKMAILITDGDYNRGINPVQIAHFFPQLHVINMPPEEGRDNQRRGQIVCQQIASAGRGYYIPVKEIEEIPRALMELLGKI
jgi:Mg-chelatase subunit ChlD